MNEQAPEKKQPIESAPSNPVPDGATSISAQSDSGNVSDDSSKANKLSPEEQMALFEKELKEIDWGHQPC